MDVLSRRKEIDIRRYERMVYRLAAQYYDPTGLNSREDFQQFARIGLWEAARDYDPSRNVSFSQFARKTIQRHLISVLKMQNRQCRRVNGPTESLYYGSDEDELSSEERFAAKDDVYLSVSAKLFQLRMLSTLSAFEREVVYLRARGLDYEEIMSELHISHKAVDNAIQRVRRKALHAHYKDFGLV